jgi:hypothetical protein
MTILRDRLSYLVHYHFSACLFILHILLNHIAEFVRSSLHLVFLKLLFSLACVAFTVVICKQAEKW